MDFVFYLSVDWDNFFRRHLILELARQLNGDSRLLCVQRPVCPLTTTIRHTKKMGKWLVGFLQEEGHLRRLTNNLHLFTPFICLHDQLAPKVPGMLWLNSKMLSFQLERVVKHLGFRQESLITWLFNPHQFDYMNLLTQRHLIYDCYDEYLAPTSYPNPRRLGIMRTREYRILQKASLVFASSEDVANRRKLITNKTYFVPNGADCTHFLKATDTATRVPDDIGSIKRPIVGFVGTMNESIDFDLLAYTSRRRRDWSIVLVGPFYSCRPGFLHSAKVREARSCQNIYIIGARPYDEIPKYIKAFDVCVIPYKDTEFNRNRSPVKLFEYMASGKPVVSIGCAQARLFAPPVALADSPEAFVEAISDMLNKDPALLRKQELEIARQNSWEDRAKKILRIIKEELG